MMKYFDATVSDKAILKKDIIRDLVYLKAEELLVGKNAMVMMPVDALDIKFDIPSTTRFTPDEVAEGAVADYQKLTFFQIYANLKKYQTRVLITDESKARQIANSQVQMSLDAAARGLAYQIDYNIFSALNTGAGNTTAAGSVWTGGTADPATDIANAMGEIINTTTLTDADFSNMYIFYPAKVFGHLAKPIQVGEIQQTLRNWAQKEYNINIMPTRMLSTSAMCVVKSMETAVHMTYSGSAIPTAEEERYAGVGDMYLITQYFTDKVIPYASGQTTSKRICTITGVCT